MHDERALTPAALRASPTLGDVRASIDRVDRDIVDLLAERRGYALQAARLKTAMKDPAREAQVLSNVTALAARRGIEPALVESLYRELITGFVRAELALGGEAAPAAERANIAALDAMPSPEELKQRVPVSEGAAATVVRGRRDVEAILDGRDPRLLVVVGPCSVHDTAAGLDYARRLRALADEVSDTLLLVMRVYLEKPRTSVGWEGFTNDPRLDGSFRVAEGLERARRFLVEVNELGLPVGTEALDPIAPQYRGDSRDLERHRRAHRRVADPPQPRLRPVHPHRLQERDGRERGRGGERHPRRLAPARVPRHRRPRALRRDPHARERLRPRGAARRRGAPELRQRLRLPRGAGARAGRPPLPRRRRLLPRQLLEEPRPAAVRGARRREPESATGTRPSSAS